ncbi:hypothetical protein [Leptospira bandrabouensis]|uniref:Uncharacterized protein n=1 Tax=Leptospira bandrabouensis TaxID=2484903 RepID=A0A6H3NP53_9LEPT|nr:hypothetical protein [Leptospira bandrabouensis]TGN11602.1 hypothetical protein EHR08_17060 [Leptospira bandrabouensis]
MKSTKVISNLSEQAPLRYEIETIWGEEKDRKFVLTIARLPEYAPKNPTNDVIDISNNNNLLGFANDLAIGFGTFRLALPAISTLEKKIVLNFNADYLREMTHEELLFVQSKIAETLNFLNSQLTNDINYINQIDFPFEN